MRKQILWTILALCTGLMLAQGGISGTGQVTVVNPPLLVLYGWPAQFTIHTDLSSVTGSATVGLGGFVVPVGFDATKFMFINATNGDLPGNASANPPTLTFVNTDPSIANANGFFAVVGATSVDSVGPTYNVAAANGFPLDFSSIALDLTAPAGAPAQVALSLSSKWTASNGGPANIPAAASDSSLSMVGKLPLQGGDYDGDGKSDFAVYNTFTGMWNILTQTGSTLTYGWGNTGDVPVPGDYDGDGKTDYAVYRPANGWWLVWTQTGVYKSYGWGLPGDIPMPGDYDGDGTADWAIYRPSNGWWLIMTQLGAYMSYGWGNLGDIPVPADYDGDGFTDPAVYRPSNGYWFVTTHTGGYYSYAWGLTGDVPVPADYDGDGTADWAVYRPSNGWWLTMSQLGVYRSAGWGGSAGDIPMPGHYTTADLPATPSACDWAIYRASNHYWFILSPTDAYVSQQWGGTQDIAIGK